MENASAAEHGTRHPTAFRGMLAVALMLAAGACRPDARGTAGAPTADGSPLLPKTDRIVSLAPSITEIVCALGLEKRVAGATRYCDFPPAMQAVPRVGGYYDPNYEAILALQPSLVIMLEQHETARHTLTQLGLDTATVDTSTIDATLSAIDTIGRITGRRPAAAALRGDIESRIRAIAERTARLSRPRVLVTIGRTMGVQTLADVSIVGRDGFYDPLVRAAGGVNAYGGDLKFPRIGREGILELDPEVIVELAAELDTSALSAAEAAAEWNAVPEVAAVKNRRVHVLTEDYVTIPGPRFVLLLEKMARLIHPEQTWPRLAEE